MICFQMLRRARSQGCQSMWRLTRSPGDGWSGIRNIVILSPLEYCHPVLSGNIKYISNSLRWKNPEVMPLYYTIEKKEDSQSAEWEPLTDHKIDPEEASYLSKSCLILHCSSYGINLHRGIGRRVYVSSYLEFHRVSKLISNTWLPLQSLCWGKLWSLSQFNKPLLHWEAAGATQTPVLRPS